MALTVAAANSSNGSIRRAIVRFFFVCPLSFFVSSRSRTSRYPIRNVFAQQPFHNGRWNFLGKREKPKTKPTTQQGKARQAGSSRVACVVNGKLWM
jgi:hypothetical protein